MTVSFQPHQLWLKQLDQSPASFSHTDRHFEYALLVVIHHRCNSKYVTLHVPVLSSKILSEAAILHDLLLFHFKGRKVLANLWKHVHKLLGDTYLHTAINNRDHFFVPSLCSPEYFGDAASLSTYFSGEVTCLLSPRPQGLVVQCNENKSLSDKSITVFYKLLMTSLRISSSCPTWRWNSGGVMLQHRHTWPVGYLAAPWKGGNNVTHKH